MIETIFQPSWIKDAVGVLLVIAAGSLYAAGVTHMSPCDCGAVVDDDVDVETIDTPIGAVPQTVVTLHPQLRT